MKKLLLIGISLVSAMSFAQTTTPRMVLVEHFTQASCGPCAGYNPGLQAMLDDSQNAGQLTSIKYQVSWPGYDPMYNHNSNQVDTRVSYYGVNSVPNPQLNGNYFNGTGFTQSDIDGIKSQPSVVMLDVSHGFNDNMDEISVDLKVKALQNISGSLVAHIVVIEKEINFSSPPGSNGERDFYHIMKRMLPSATGTSLGSSMNAGDSVELSYSWKLANIYNNDELAVVAFVQDNNNDYVHQAGYSAPIPFTPAHSLNVQSIEMENVSLNNCNGKVSPILSFRNAGSTTITSASFNYSINGGAVNTYNYSGNLAFGAEDIVQLNEVSFTVNATNELLIYPVSVNGGADEYTIGDTLSFAFEDANVYNANVTVKMFTGTHADVLSWKIIDSNGDIVFKENTYTNNTSIEDQYTLTKDDCYEFIFSHPGESYNGSLFFYDANNSLIMQIFGGTDFETSNMFKVDPATLGVDEVDVTNVSVYPNPSNGNLIVSSDKVENFYITDVSGKRVFTGKTNGSSKIVETNLTPGMYIFSLDSDVKSHQKLIIK